jgi:phosphohistidine phosphatase
MKTLLILRHAKSSWDDPDLPDIDRPLNKRGKRDAPRVGQRLRQQDLVPDLILSSPARRARQTAEAVALESGFGGDIEIRTDFYPGEPDDYIENLGQLPDEVERVMVVGHNPGLESLLVELTGESAALPTAALAQVEVPVQSWDALSEAPESRLINLWRVKEMD